MAAAIDIDSTDPKRITIWLDASYEYVDNVAGLGVHVFRVGAVHRGVDLTDVYVTQTVEFLLDPCEEAYGLVSSGDGVENDVEKLVMGYEWPTAHYFTPDTSFYSTTGDFGSLGTESACALVWSVADITGPGLFVCELCDDPLAWIHDTATGQVELTAVLDP